MRDLKPSSPLPEEVAEGVPEELEASELLVPDPESPGMRDFKPSSPLPKELEESELLPEPESPGMRDFKASSPLLVPVLEPRPGSWRFWMVGVGAAMAMLAKARMIVDFMLKRGNYIYQRMDLRDRLCSVE